VKRHKLDPNRDPVLAAVAIILHKLIVAQLVKKFLASHVTGMFIAVFTRAENRKPSDLYPGAPPGFIG
jgi:hypothetical protein